MNLNSVVQVDRPSAMQDLPRHWSSEDSWLAGGTWLYSEPQHHLRRLVDLMGLGWPPLTVSGDGLDIAATCTIAELYAFQPPVDWHAAALIPRCCRAFQSSFKVWNAATVGGNICLALPAGPITALACALGGTATVRDLEGGHRRMPVVDVVTGSGRTSLRNGDILRSIHLPVRNLRIRTSFRRISLTREGRSTALLIGTADPHTGACLLMVTAATVRPVQIRFAQVPAALELREAIVRDIPDTLYLNDAHGDSAYRRHMTAVLAEEIREELAQAPPPMGDRR